MPYLCLVLLRLGEILPGIFFTTFLPLWFSESSRPDFAFMARISAPVGKPFIGLKTWVKCCCGIAYISDI